jgi:hypothetical protein
LLSDAACRPARAVSLCELSFGLLGCSNEKPNEQPSFYKSMATADAKVDAKAAASMISGYRRNNGLGIVTLDDKLMRMAEQQARAMASKDKFEHDAAGAVSPSASSAPDTTRKLQLRISERAITRWRRPSPAGAIRPRTGPICCIAA